MSEDPEGPVGEEPPALVVTCGGSPYTVQPGDGAITIGRELPAQIRIPDPRMSRIHLRVEVQAGRWVLIDAGSTNGVFVDGRKVQSAPVSDGMTIHLGHADGIPVTFTHAAIETADSSVLDDTADGEILTHADPGVMRVGAAVADRRLELGYSQRQLAEDKVVSQSVLGAFERGRSWPRTTTRTRIEEYLRWPPGTLARIRDGAAAPDDDDREETTEFLSDTVRVSVLVDAVEIALRGINVRIASLGLPTDHGFSVDATDLLTELRRLDGMLSTAATGPRSSPEVAMLLGEVRRTYHALMEEAARSPDATIGQRLYLARHRAQLSTAEVAHAAGVSAADVDECEAGRLVSADAIAALEEVIAALSSR